MSILTQLRRIRIISNNAIQPFSSGTFKSAEGFSPSLDAEIVGVGNDYIHADPDGSRLRLDAHGTIKYAPWQGLMCSCMC